MELWVHRRIPMPMAEQLHCVDIGGVRFPSVIRGVQLQVDCLAEYQAVRLTGSMRVGAKTVYRQAFIDRDLARRRPPDLGYIDTIVNGVVEGVLQHAEEQPEYRIYNERVWAANAARIRR